MILVVKDEEDLRQLLVSFLDKLGYQVLGAGAADTAIAILKATPLIDFLLPDVVIGSGMNGSALHLMARQRYPDFKALFISA